MVALPYELELVGREPGTLGRAIFPRDFFAFDGHFSGNPILPGFVHIQAALDLLALTGRPAELMSVHSAKFVSPIRPGEVVSIELTMVSSLEYGVTMSVEGRLCSRFHLVTQDRPPGPR